MSKILIFENPQDFIQNIEDLQTEYNKRQDTQTSKGEGTQWVNQQD